jgi:hypothetical protein
MSLPNRDDAGRGPSAGPGPRTNLLLAAGFLGLALGLVVLDVVMHRPIPSQITSWGPVSGLPSWLGDLAPDTRSMARLALGLTFAGLLAVHLVLLGRLRGSAPERGTLAILSGGAALLSTIVALAPYQFSGDIHAYVMYGRVSALHGANPMITPPSAFPSDPFLASMTLGYHDTPSVYGPAWNALSHGLTLAAEAWGGREGTYLLLYHLVCLAGFVASIWALWTLLGRWRPDDRVVGTALYAWSPLALVEAGAVHNDFVMLGLIGAGIVLASKDRHRAAVALLVTAVLVKWIAVVVLVVLSLEWARRAAGRTARLRRVALDVGIVLVITAAFAVGFSDPVRSLMSPFTSAGTDAINSLAELATIGLFKATAVLGHGLTVAEATAVFTATGKVLVVVIFVVVGRRAWRAPTVQAGIAAAASGLLAITIVAPKLWPWYALWVLMLAPLAGRATRLASAVLSASVLLVYVLAPVPGGRTLVTASLPVWIVVPVLVVLALELRRGAAGSATTVRDAAPM